MLDADIFSASGAFYQPAPTPRQACPYGDADRSSRDTSPCSMGREQRDSRRNEFVEGTATLSHYKILAELSRSGMGIVYKALDIKLKREVAIKVLPPQLVSDPERKRRFVQGSTRLMSCAQFLLGAARFFEGSCASSRAER